MWRWKFLLLIRYDYFTVLNNLIITIKLYLHNIKILKALPSQPEKQLTNFAFLHKINFYFSIFSDYSDKNNNNNEKLLSEIVMSSKRFCTNMRSMMVKQERTWHLKRVLVTFRKALLFQIWYFSLITDRCDYYAYMDTRLRNFFWKIKLRQT